MADHGRPRQATAGHDSGSKRVENMFYFIPLVRSKGINRYKPRMQSTKIRREPL
jgi:hypothetical protein